MDDLKSFLGKIEKVPLHIYIFFLAATGYIVYFRALFGDFLWDDLATIPNNPAIQNIQNIPFFFTRSVFYSSSAHDLIGLYYRPLLTTISAILYQIWGTNTFGYHLFDINVHILNSILLFFLLNKLLNLQGLHYRKALPFIFSFLFLLHPANVESVAYISATSDLLCAFFLLASLIFSLSYGTSNKKFSIYLIFIFASVLLCLFSKESGILSIFLISLLSLLYFPKKLPALFASFILPIIIYGFFRFHLAQLSTSYKTSIVTILQATIWQRLLLVPYELFTYTRLTFFPLDLHIDEQGIIKNASNPKFFLPLFVILFFTIIAFFIFRKVKSKLSFFFLAWILVSLIPFLNIIVPLDFTIDERWLYIPLMGVMGLIICCMPKLTALPAFYQKITLLILSLYFIFFFIRTFARTFDWGNELNLFGHDVSYVKDSSDLYTNYANALYRAGNIALSAQQFENAIQIAPDNFYALNNLGSIFAQNGQYDKAKKLFEHSINVAPTQEAYENIAEIDYLTQKPAFVADFVKSAILLYPNSAKLNQLMALSLYSKGFKDQAKKYAQKSAQLNSSSDNVNTLLNILQ